MNNKKSSMGKKTLIYLAGNFSSKIFGMIIIPIYAKYLTAADLGSFDFQQTIGNLLMPIIALAIWESILRFGLNASKEEVNQIITTSIVVSSLTLLVSFVILLFTYISIYGLFINTILYVLLIISMPIVTILGYISRAVKKNKIYAISGVVSAACNMVLIVIFLVIGNYGVTGLLIAAVVSNLFNSLYLSIGVQLHKRLKWKYFSIKEARKMVSYSIPLIFNLTFGWFLNSFSRFYINLSLGATANGVYAFSSKFSGIFIQVTSILNMSVIEDAVESIDSDDWTTRFEENIKKISKIFIELAILILIATAVYYNFINNSDFKESLYLVPGLIMVGILTSYSTLIGNVFPVFNKTNQIFVTTLYGGVSNIILILVLSKQFGLLGIVISQIVSATILVISRYKLGQKINPYHVEIRKNIWYLVQYIFISFFIIRFNIYIQLLILTTFSIYLVFSYRDFIKKIIRKLKKDDIV